MFIILKYMHMLEYLFGNKQNHFHHNYFLKAKDKVTQRINVAEYAHRMTESFDMFTIFNKNEGLP